MSQLKILLLRRFLGEFTMNKQNIVCFSQVNFAFGFERLRILSKITFV